MNYHFDTLLIHGGDTTDPRTKAVNTPIYQTSTYAQSALGKHSGYEYSRTKNPTRDGIESLIAQLEGGAFGFAFASGMAAISCVLSLFKSGDKILISHNVYGGTFRVLDKVFANFNISYELIDMRDIELLEKSIDSSVKALLLETPANPLMSVISLEEIARIAKKHRILSIVDNTFMTPYLQRPLEFGIDIVVHSATKYLGGHSDLIAGLVVVNDKTLGERLGFLQNSIGAILAPFDSFLLIRGIKTLGLRMQKHCENALYIARFLSKNQAIEKVYYPFLDSDNGYTIQKSQASGGGGMISFELKEGYDYKTFLESTQIIVLAESLGGVESLLCHPASMTHASIPQALREQIGIKQNLIRLSVGIENVKDLCDDIAHALSQSQKTAKQ
ncbi:PLP-dependent aspartate aminotransferase family protein [Helicobacter fennelliae]|uniref:trans-sulfuration enzyme family protein n=2 Tax=Helicobacter TaxID=209 RepID=UPI000DFEEE35|nr:PLP-dependent aspartate aminotransferase family protein [Helicobacter fennelliae]STQ84342.1 cystathionine gamma-synthase [Helicobacter fennelliae]